MSSATGRQTTILVMDDDASVRSLITELLAEKGYSVIQSASSRDGLDLARQHHPDVVLLDLTLPPTSGQDLLNKLRTDEGTRHIPVVVVSGCRPSTVGDVNGRPDGVLQKPFDVTDLLAHIERLT
jgi:CheY-like chemotaxis protein